MTCSRKIDGKHSRTNDQSSAFTRVELIAFLSFCDSLVFPFSLYDLRSTLENLGVIFFAKKFKFSTLFVLGSGSRSRRFHLESSIAGSNSCRESWLVWVEVMSTATLSTKYIDWELFSLLKGSAIFVESKTKIYTKYELQVRYLSKINFWLLLLLAVAECALWSPLKLIWRSEENKVFKRQFMAIYSEEFETKKLT